jgi:hypothetical protein
LTKLIDNHSHVITAAMSTCKSHEGADEVRNILQKIE